MKWKEFILDPVIYNRSPQRILLFPDPRPCHFLTSEPHLHFSSSTLSSMSRLPIHQKLNNSNYTIEGTSLRKRDPMVIWEIIFNFVYLHPCRVSLFKTTKKIDRKYFLLLQRLGPQSKSTLFFAGPFSHQKGSFSKTLIESQIHYLKQITYSLFLIEAIGGSIAATLIGNHKCLIWTWSRLSSR